MNANTHDNTNSGHERQKLHADTTPPDARRDWPATPGADNTRPGPMHPVRIAALRRALDALPLDVVCDAIGKEVGDFLAGRASELDSLRARISALERHAKTLADASPSHSARYRAPARRKRK